MNHEWNWADSAPEVDVPDSLRLSAIVETCKLCGVTSMRKNGTQPWHGQRFLICRKTFTSQPICPDSCEESLAVKKAFEELDNRKW